MYEYMATVFMHLLNAFSVGKSVATANSHEQGIADTAVCSEDVSERLIAKGREAQRRKVKQLLEKEEEDAKYAFKSVPICKGSETIVANNDSMK